MAKRKSKMVVDSDSESESDNEFTAEAKRRAKSRLLKVSDSEPDSDLELKPARKRSTHSAALEHGDSRDEIQKMLEEKRKRDERIRKVEREEEKKNKEMRERHALEDLSFQQMTEFVGDSDVNDFMPNETISIFARELDPATVSIKLSSQTKSSGSWKLFLEKLNSGEERSVLTARTPMVIIKYGATKTCPEDVCIALVKLVLKWNKDPTVNLLALENIACLLIGREEDSISDRAGSDLAEIVKIKKSTPLMEWKPDCAFFSSVFKECGVDLEQIKIALISDQDRAWSDDLPTKCAAGNVVWALRLLELFLAADHFMLTDDDGVVQLLTELLFIRIDGSYQQEKLHCIEFALNAFVEAIPKQMLIDSVAKSVFQRCVLLAKKADRSWLSQTSKPDQEKALMAMHILLNLLQPLTPRQTNSNHLIRYFAVRLILALAQGNTETNIRFRLVDALQALQDETKELSFDQAAPFEQMLQVLKNTSPLHESNADPTKKKMNGTDFRILAFEARLFHVLISVDLTSEDTEVLRKAKVKVFRVFEVIPTLMPSASSDAATYRLASYVLAYYIRKYEKYLKGTSLSETMDDEELENIEED